MDRFQYSAIFLLRGKKLGSDVVTNHVHLSRRVQSFLDPFEQHPHELCTRVVCGFPTVDAETEQVKLDDPSGTQEACRNSSNA